MAKTYGGRWVTTGETLGEGGQAQALWVTDGPSGPRFVLKRLKNPARIGRLETEIAALSELHSSRIPPIIDSSLSDPAFLVMHYAGVPLSSLITDGLAFDRAIDLFRDVVEAVRDAHDAGLVHRDIKPANIVVANERASLIDFGICQFVSGQYMNTVVDEAFGARSFAGPEMELGSDLPAGPAADIYALGKLLFWMTSGGSTFARENITESSLAKMQFARRADRGHVERWLRACVTEHPRTRVTSQELLDLVDRDVVLMRRSINAVGSLNQPCGICGIGTLEPRGVDDLLPLGLKANSVNVSPATALRFLLCSHCGHLQTHLILSTTGQGLWEF